MLVDSREAVDLILWLTVEHSALGRTGRCLRDRHCFQKLRSPILKRMNRHQISATGKLALSIGAVVAAFAAALFNAFRGLLASTENASEEQRSIQDADLVGDYNFRTQRFDAGNDPAGWYEDEL